MLIRFSGNADCGYRADGWEKIGNVSLGLLSVGLGKVVAVEKFSVRDQQGAFKKQRHSRAWRAGALTVFLLGLPLTATLAGLGYIAKQRSPKYRQLVQAYEKQKAATILQKYVRGHLARKSHLPQGNHAQYHSLCQSVASMPRASGGKTAVFLPPENPEIVLKYAGRERATIRFHQMQETRAVLKAQNSSHLIIPKANLCGEFLIEQRLPINVCNFHNMSLYISQPQLFNEAVREMTRLSLKMEGFDITGPNARIPLSMIEGVNDYIRHDNYPLYIVDNKGQKEGCIGFIDIEHMRPRKKEPDLATLVRVFPYHVEIIKEEANRLKIIFKPDALDTAAATGRKFFQVGYVDHLAWLKREGISTASTSHPLDISPQIIAQLDVLVEKELLRLNAGTEDWAEKDRGNNLFRNFFKDTPEELTKELAPRLVQTIVTGLKEQIKKDQEAFFKKQGHNKPLTEAELIDLRSATLRRSDIYAEAAKGITTHTKIEFSHRVWTSGKIENCITQLANSVAEQLFCVVMVELVKVGKIYYFDPAFYTGGYGTCWIRY